MQDHSYEGLTLTTITKPGMVMSRVYRLSPIKRISIHFNRVKVADAQGCSDSFIPV